MGNLYKPKSLATVRAMQFTEENEQRFDDWLVWRGAKFSYGKVFVAGGAERKYLSLESSDGAHHILHYGDYVVNTPEGEWFNVPASVFPLMYEETELVEGSNG